ncbi:hypothetical protein RD792_003280 [Penstemon davidsonii]|uniref:RecF/RecN/SMC N-terminal domain-containing protein n=1 Tax=Penstemon davidsonii TaxID=160366 RepID=A0ABR0DU25_9LAMI|nr:hypothetical protein RD792_003280 [Penstemon davidsonii]
MEDQQHISGKIHRLELDNFKSYEGHQTIGPFYDFTAIIGPNGAGKSNLMDAISFVLGVRTAQLRGAKLLDFIYAIDDRDKEQKGRRAHVKLVYQLLDGSEITFTRSISSAGGSEYRIGDRVVNWDEYNAKLRSLGILVKARNFLVFQGDVESIASKNPKELSALFEQISGSEDYKRQYEELEVQKAEADEKAVLAHQRRKAIIAEKKQKKLQKEEAEKHIKLQEQLDVSSKCILMLSTNLGIVSIPPPQKSLKQEHFLWQLLNIQKDIEKANKDLDVEESSRKDIVDELDNYQAEANKKKKEKAGYLKEIGQCERRISDKKNKLDSVNYLSSDAIIFDLLLCWFGYFHAHLHWLMR